MVLTAPASSLCPVCDGGGNDATSLARRYGIQAPYRFLHCGSCALHWVDPLPAPGVAWTPEVYDEAYYRNSGLIGAAGNLREEGLSEKLTCRLRNAAILDLLERHAPGRRLLDVGCGVGLMLRHASQRGWKVSGIEASAFPARYACEKLGFDVQEGGILSASLPSSSFDAITILHVLEHLERPVAVMDRLAALLAPGGALVVEVPNEIGYLTNRIRMALTGRVAPYAIDHLVNYSPRALARLLERTGWEVRHLWTGSKEPCASDLPGGAWAKRALASLEVGLKQGKLVRMLATRKA